MLSETLDEGLANYRIGPKIRALRLAKKLGLVQLGEHTGLSAALLSKIERGQLYPTLPTLLRIALVFGVGLDHFFSADEEKVVVVRNQDRLRLPSPPGEESPAYFFESLDYPARDRPFESYYAEFDARPSEPHSHDGVEFIYVLDGELLVDIDGKKTALQRGDSIHFDASEPHSYCRGTSETCSAIVVVANGSR